ncbi:MAG: TetR/AcrR family transcriptional regulator [Pseudomonadota bacterium]
MARTAGSHSETTGPRVHAAAERLFARHGYAAVSMRQIAAEVGVQAGALYNYTVDKQSLLAELMVGHLKELLEAWNQEPCPDLPLQALESFARFHIRFHLDRPDAVFIAYMELRNLAPENYSVVERLRRDYESVLEDILRDGQRKGVFSVADVRLTTMALIAMLTGVNTWYRDGGRLTRERVERIYWHMVRRAVKAA